MIEILVVLAFSWGGYEYGKASVEPQVCNTAALTPINCPDIMPPEMRRSVQPPGSIVN